MATGFCPNCGTPRGAGNFCANCGQPFDAAGLSQAQVSANTPLPGTPDAIGVAPRIRADVPDFVAKQLHPGEQVLGTFSASLFDHRHQKKWSHDKFALTTDRVIFFQNSWIHKEMDQIPYRSITGVQFNKGLVHGKVVIEAAHVALTMNGIANGDAAFAERVISASITGRTFRLTAPDVTTRDKVGEASVEAVGKAGRWAVKAAGNQVAAYRERRAKPDGAVGTEAPNAEAPPTEPAP